MIVNLSLNLFSGTKYYPPLSYPGNNKFNRGITPSSYFNRLSNNKFNASEPEITLFPAAKQALAKHEVQAMHND